MLLREAGRSLCWLRRLNDPNHGIIVQLDPILPNSLIGPHIDVLGSIRRAKHTKHLPRFTAQGIVADFNFSAFASPASQEANIPPAPPEPRPRSTPVRALQYVLANP